jgi:hypothetical protein
VAREIPIMKLGTAAMGMLHGSPDAGLLVTLVFIVVDLSELLRPVDSAEIPLRQMD